MVTDANPPRGRSAAKSTEAESDAVNSNGARTSTSMMTATHYNVRFKGEAGKLTLTDKIFSFQKDLNDDDDSTNKNVVKCGWAHVTKRQTSPPNATQPMLKLFLASGRTAVFQVDDLTTLIGVLKDVKLRMEQHTTARAQEAETQKKLRGTGTDTNTNQGGRVVRDLEQARTSRTTKSRSQSAQISPSPLVTVTSSTADPSEDEDGNSKNIWDRKMWRWLFILTTVVAMGLAAAFIYLLVTSLGDDSRGSSSSSSSFSKNNNQPVTDLTGCQATDMGCPPDWGLESRYNIRTTHYVWSPAMVTLEYIISDYILDTSVDYITYHDGDCGNKDKLFSQQPQQDSDNSWIRVELVDAAIIDGGANLYNQGKGNRQFDILVKLLSNINIREAPFFEASSSDDEEKGTVNLCVGFLIHYNQVNGYQGKVVVNFVEHALQLNIDTTNSTSYFEDVQVRTAIKPLNIDDLEIPVFQEEIDDYYDDEYIDVPAGPGNELWCKALCGTLRCCFEDEFDCPEGVNCDEYSPCATIYTNPDSTTTTAEIPPLDEPNPTAIDTTCNDASTLDQCLHQCTPVRCCAPPLGQDGCLLGARDNPAWSDIDCSAYEVCNVLYNVPPPDLVASACGDNVASCAAVCRSVACCFSDGLNCGLSSETAGIDCAEYRPCQEFFDIAGGTQIVSGGGLASAVVLPDPDGVALACDV